MDPGICSRSLERYKGRCNGHLLVISCLPINMSTIVLDSLPSVRIRIPSETNLNVSPRNRGRKLRGQPLLGQRPRLRYTHFVPMGDASPSIKKLLEIPESQTMHSKPSDQDEANEDSAKNVVKPPAKMYSAEFKRDAQDYLNTPNIERRDNYHPREKTTPIVAKNTANLANIVAVAQPSSKTMKARARPKAKSKPKTSKKTAKKKTLMKPKKMTTFKILQKNK